MVVQMVHWTAAAKVKQLVAKLAVQMVSLTVEKMADSSGLKMVAHSAMKKAVMMVVRLDQRLVGRMVGKKERCLAALLAMRMAAQLVALKVVRKAD